MRRLTQLIFYGYVIVLVAVGCSGIFIAEWELAGLFQVPLDAMGVEARATIIGQYRFLKSLELSCGLFAILFRNEIFSVRKFTVLFLLIVFLGAGARTLSIVVDGIPHWAFIAFILYEALTGLLVFLSVFIKSEEDQDGYSA